MSIGRVLRVWVPDICYTHTKRAAPAIFWETLWRRRPQCWDGAPGLVDPIDRTNGRLSARFDLDVPDADIPWMIAAKALERIDELGYDRCAL